MSQSKEQSRWNLVRARWKTQRPESPPATPSLKAAADATKQLQSAKEEQMATPILKTMQQRIERSSLQMWKDQDCRTIIENIPPEERTEKHVDTLVKCECAAARPAAAQSTTRNHSQQT